MGGYGSGFQGTRRATVEDGLTLSISELLRKRALVPGSFTSGGWAWKQGSDPTPIGQIRYMIDADQSDDAWIRLIYTVNGESVDYKVRLETTRPNFGGQRWWFRCPISRQDGQLGARVAKLHLPPGGRYFGSRKAYRLTYTSCRESGKWNSLYGRLAAQMGTDSATVRQALANGRID